MKALVEWLVLQASDFPDTSTEGIMLDLTADELRLLKALIAAPLAWQTPAELARALRLDPEATTDLLCELDLAGWIALWESDAELKVTLSPRAAARLHARLVETRADTARGNHRPAPSGNGSEPIVDPLPPGSEDHVHPLASTAATHNGLDSTVRPSPHADALASCPDCGATRHGPRRYCINCDRWGDDEPTAGTDHSGRRDFPRPEPRRGEVPPRPPGRRSHGPRLHDHARRGADSPTRSPEPSPGFCYPPRGATDAARDQGARSIVRRSAADAAW